MRGFLTSRHWLVLFGIVGLYLVSHLVNLTSLPVFADESIYIRWAQLIIDDWQRYLFFPLNDGKTPLFIWLLVPFELAFKDPLWAGRFASVLIGLAQVSTNGYLVNVLGGKRKAVWMSMLLTTILPFWYFYHRQALIDGLMVLFLSLVIVASAKVVQSFDKKHTLFQLPSKKQLGWIIALGVSLGLALLTKLPAILFVPVIPIWAFLPSGLKPQQRLRLLGLLGVSVGSGLVIFALLRLSPAFGQLFHRGGDFLYGLREVLGGKWRDTLPSTTNYINYFISYTHLTLVLAFVASLFGKRKRTYHVLFWSAIIFCLPMVVLGKVVYARYFLSAMIFLTAGVSLFLEEVLETYVQGAKNMMQRMGTSVVMALILANVMATSGLFIYFAIYHPNQIPFVPSDRVQYLTEWSSGHGIVETAAFIRQEAKGQKVAVATEGFFGTLPDALLMYFHSQPDPNVYIEGIGQPVTNIPEFFATRSAGYAKKYLVVNDYRLKMKLDDSKLVKQFCRPFYGPCLQIWDISELQQ